MSSHARARLRYMAGLPGFLRARPGPEECRRIVGDQFAVRSDALLAIFERAVFGNPSSPYRALLAAAGVELGDVARMLAADGLEPTLRSLHRAGVALSIDEFKGRVPIERPGLELAASPSDFDNPLLRRHYEARTSGSRSGTGSRIAIDLDLLAHEAAHLSLCLEGFGALERPFAAWRPVLPGLAGLKGMLRRAHLGLRSEAWFSQYGHRDRRSAIRYSAMTDGTLALAFAAGSPIPRPQRVPLERADLVARWLAERVGEGTPAHLDTNWSSAVRVCAEAQRSRLDLSGTLFRVGGEPTTPARVEAIAAAGSDYAAHYSMGEAGWIGVACPHRRRADEVHLLADKLAVIQPPAAERPGGAPLLLTTLLPSCPKILINVDVGDHAVLSERDCTCPFGRLGMTQTLHSIASHEKLTTEGMNFVASEIAWLLEEALPARFGGGLGDYQLVEDRSGALSSIAIVIDPSVRAPADPEVTATVLELLGGLGDGQRLMAEQWRQAGAMHVRRRAPYVAGGKVQHLHVVVAQPQR